MMAQTKLEGSSFTLHAMTLLLEGDGFLDDLLIIDATAPDGVRRSLSIRDWHIRVLNRKSGEAWGRMGAMILQKSRRLQFDLRLPESRRNFEYLEQKGYRINLNRPSQPEG
jgi:hypothetical protein